MAPRATYKFNKRIDDLVRQCARDGLSQIKTFEVICDKNYQDTPGSMESFRRLYRASYHDEQNKLIAKATSALEYHLDEKNLDAAKFTLERKGGWHKVDLNVNTEADAGEDNEGVLNVLMESLGHSLEETEEDTNDN